MSTYEEFRLDISPLPDGEWSVRARSQRGQEGSAKIRLPFGDDAYIGFMNAIKHRMPLSELDVKQLGTLMYDTLFENSDLKDSFQTSQAQAKNEGKNLRIVLAIDPAAKDAAAFPWEFASNDNGEPLVNRHSIVRYLPRTDALPSLKVDGPLTMLLASALPPGLNAPIDVEAERQAVLASVQPMVDSGKLKIIEEKNLTTRALQKAVTRNKVHIFHFIGHGVVDKNGMGHLVLDNGSGERSDLSAQRLATLFGPSPIRLVVLNACKTSTITAELLQAMAPSLLAANVPAVVAMQSAIRDSAGRDFADEFYYQLSEGHPIDLCVAEGRRAMMFAEGSSIDWGLVTLYMRAADGHLFNNAATDVPEDAATTPSGGVNSSIDFGSGNIISGANISMGNVGTTIQGGAPATPAGTAGAGLTEDQQKEIEHLRAIVDVKKRTYRAEKLKAARYGMNVPADVVIHIEDLASEITQLEKQIAELGG